MPELPEVETTRRGIAPAIATRVIEQIIVREPRLRWRVPEELIEDARGQPIRELRRRAAHAFGRRNAHPHLWRLQPRHAQL